MNKTKYFLGKNHKNIEKNSQNGNDKLPYFTLYQIPEEQGGKWIQLGAAWKSKTGKGYNFSLAKGVKFISESADEVVNEKDIPDKD